MGAFVRLAYPGYRVAERLAMLVPERAVPALTWVAGTVAMRVSRRRARMVARHLRRVRGPELRGRALRRAVRATFVSYAAYWLDTFRLPLATAEDLDRRVEAEGLEHLDAALAAGRGAILATPHLGSWDLGGAWVACRGYPLVAVVERLKPPELLDWFVGIRQRIGIEVIVRGPEVWEQLEKALRANKVVVLVCDRDLSGRGVPVRFFGEETTLPAGPARLARTCDTPVLPVAVYGLARCCHRGVVRPPLDIERTADEEADITAASQALAGALEELIRAAPEQWHLMQPNWPSDREATGG